MSTFQVTVKFRVDVKEPNPRWGLDFLATLDSYLNGVPQVSEWDVDSEDREDFLILEMELQ